MLGIPITNVYRVIRQLVETYFGNQDQHYVPAFYVPNSPIFDFIWINVIRLGMCYN